MAAWAVRWRPVSLKVLRVRILLIDNYDSFTWNLHHLLAQHAEVVVARNDAITVTEAAAFDRIVVSPGAGLPNEAGITMEVIRALLPTHPLMGVCLGMQALVEACGGSLYNQGQVRHGVAVPCIAEDPLDPLFAGLPSPFDAALYHSWAADRDALPSELSITAKSTDGVIMAVRHKYHPACGVQFHPESILTSHGARIISNWLAS